MSNSSSALTNVYIIISSGRFSSSIVSVSHRHSHPDPQPQSQALPQPPQLLLSQPDLVLQLPLLHQQGGLHLHIVATKGGKKNRGKYFFKNYFRVLVYVIILALRPKKLWSASDEVRSGRTCSRGAARGTGSGPAPGWRPALCGRRGPSGPEPPTAASWADASSPAGGAGGQREGILKYLIIYRCW